MLYNHRIVRRTCLATLLAGASLAAASGPLLQPQAGLATATMARVELNSDSRYVLFRSESIPLPVEANIFVGVEAEIIVPIEIPASLRGAELLAVQAELSINQIEHPELANALDIANTPRLHLSSETLLWSPGQPSGLQLRFAIPKAARGKAGLLRVSARRLRGAGRTALLGPLPAPRTASLLRFSYGIEPRGWHEESPPLRFRVALRGDDGEETLLWERLLDPARQPRDRNWHEASLRLDATDDGSQALRFSVQPVALPGAAAVADIVGVFANPTLQTDGVQDARRNVILISLDTLRATSLGAYGYARATSPQIDRRMAAAGTVVAQAITPMPFTPASHMTMLTGLDPCEHLVVGIEDQLAADQATLAEILRDAGYTTAAFTENAFLVAGGGFDRGFDSYQENRSDENQTDGLARETFAAASEWLAQASTGPFFLFVHTYQVHEPYAPPRAYETLLPDTPGLVGPQRLRDLYDREIRYLDDLVGDFLDSIDRLGLAENTLIVLTSDHGEGFAETKFDASGHGLRLYDSVLHVPLILRAPGLVPAGATINPVVGLIDLTPTILDLLEINSPLPVTGRSFAGLVRGDDDGFVERPVFARPVPVGREPGTGFAPGGVTGLRTGEWKRLYQAGYPGRLFSLKDDPQETRNVAAEQPAVVAKLDAAILAHRAWCAEMQEKRAGGTVRPARRPDWLDDTSANMRDKQNEVRRKLQALGYIE